MLAVGESRKRSSQDIIDATMELKKHKVGFVDEPSLFTTNSKDGNSDDRRFKAEMYRRFVKSALDDLDKKNDPTQLDVLADQLLLSSSSKESIGNENLGILLDVLSNSINRIDNIHGNRLIHSIINLEKWWELPSFVLGKYISFIRILCSSIPKWWQDVAMVLISSFTLSVEKTTSHHDMLKYFLRTIPSSIGYIDAYLAKFFPNKNDTKKNLANYISNVLSLTVYCQELRFQAYSLLVSKMISIDVELQNELDELDDDIEDDDELEEEEEEDDEDNNNNNSSDSEDETDCHKVNDADDYGEDDDELMEGDEEYHVEVSQSIKELSAKLDAILTLVSKHLEEQITPESLESGNGVSIFNTLTSLFKTHVLPTYYTRSIQYIMFHLSQQQSELMDSYLVTMIDISFSPNETSEKKIKSLQYLGSYIARAKKLSRTQIIFVASYLTSWLNRYHIEREEEADQPGGMERFKHFYAAFQSLCYMFCFRHSLLKDVDGNWECDLDKFFQKMVISKFNPLKYCNENVMLMFARITQHEGIAYCFSIIENNNNERLRGIMGRASTDNDRNNQSTQSYSAWSLVTRQQFIDLQSYFPFDPLFLKNYKNMMKEYYIEWKDASGEYESDDSEE